VDNRFRPEEGRRGGICDEGVDHVCVSWIGRVRGRGGDAAGTGVAVGWAGRPESWRESKVARLVRKASRGIGSGKGVQERGHLTGLNIEN
jgi:hypothetical protein